MVGDISMLDVMRIGYESRNPMLFWGAPGVGKTATIEAFARSVGADLIVPQIRAPEDIALPVATPEGVRVLPVDAFMQAARGGNKIIFIDEITTLPPAVQAAALRFLDSGRVGDVKIPDDVWRIGAANPPEMAAGGWELEPPTANRLMHVEWKLDPLEWAESFADYWGNPPRRREDWDRNWNQARLIVGAFIRARPNLLLAVPKTAAERGRAWPSPRTWDMASRAWAQVNLSADRAFIVFSWAVGTAAAREFVAWLESAALPDPEDVLAGRADVPRRPDLAWAALHAVVQAVASNLDSDRYVAAWKVCAGVAERGQADVAATSARKLADLRVENPRLPLPVEHAKRFSALLARG